MPSPLHGKQAYVFISSGNITNLMSFAVSYLVNFTPQAIARANVLGTDAVPGVEAQGYTARARIELLLSEDEPEWDAALGNRSQNANQIDIDFNTAVVKLQSEQEWAVTNKLNVILVVLRNNLKVADATNFSNLIKLAGKIMVLTDCPIVGLEESARVGDYYSVRLEVETGRWRKLTNKVDITA